MQETCKYGSFEFPHPNSRFTKKPTHAELMEMIEAGLDAMSEEDGWKYHWSSIDFNHRGFDLEPVIKINWVAFAPVVAM